MWRLIFVFIAALGGFWFGKGPEVKEKAIPNIHPEKNFGISEHKSFVIVLYASNQAAWCERALRSIFEQEYDHYRLIFVDDGSSDGTGEKANQFIIDNNQTGKAIVIRNEMKAGKAASLYRVIDGCLDREIVIPLDAKDWLSSPFVLSQLNSAYQNPDVWLLFGNSIEYPSYEKIDQPQCSFYAALFKQIRLEDLFVEGEFIKSSRGYLNFLKDLSGGRIRYLQEPLFFFNTARPTLEEEPPQKVAQYEPLSSFPTPSTATSADILIFSFDRPLQLYACLESIQRYITGFENITVLYRVSEPKFEMGYSKVKESFPAVHFVAQGLEKPKRDFKPNVNKIVFDSPSEYILFAVDDIIVTDFVDLKECMALVEKTGAYGFYLRLGNRIDYCYQGGHRQLMPVRQQLFGNVFAWDIGSGEYDWGFANSLDMTLYKKEPLKSSFLDLDFQTPNSLESRWTKEFCQDHAIGLYFDHAKLVNIPMNIVGRTGNPHMNYLTTDELLTRFDQGFKIDIEPLYQVENHSPHIEYIPEFIPR
jgi:hypothetical protein